MSRDLSDVYEAMRLAEKEGRTEDVKKLTAYLESLPAEEPEFDPRDLKSTLGGAAIGAGAGAVGVPLLRAGAKEAAQIGKGIPVTSAFQEVPPQRSGFERMIQGGVDPESGTTGRARNIAYNEMTHNIAERAKMQQQNMGELAKKGVIDPRKLATAVDTGGYGATPSGVLAPSEAVSAQSKSMPMGQRIREGMSQLPQKAVAFGSGIANYRLPIVGAVGPVIGRGLSGAGAGYQAVDMSNRFDQGDYLGGTISGLGALGSAATLLPHPIAKGVGFTIGVGAEGLNRYLDYLKQKAQQPQQQPQEPQQEMPVPMAQGGLAHFAKGGSTTPAWQRKEGKSPSGGLNAVGRASYKRETGGELKAPQPGGGSRKKSFCARMGGMKKKLTSSKTANDPDSRINKALRKWKCQFTSCNAFQTSPPQQEENREPMTAAQS